MIVGYACQGYEFSCRWTVLIQFRGWVIMGSEAPSQSIPGRKLLCFVWVPTQLPVWVGESLPCWKATHRSTTCSCSAHHPGFWGQTGAPVRTATLMFSIWCEIEVFESSLDAGPVSNSLGCCVWLVVGDATVRAYSSVRTYGKSLIIFQRDPQQAVEAWITGYISCKNALIGCRSLLFFLVFNERVGCRADRAAHKGKNIATRVCSVGLLLVFCSFGSIGNYRQSLVMLLGQFSEVIFAGLMKSSPDQKRGLPYILRKFVGKVFDSPLHKHFVGCDFFILAFLNKFELTLRADKTRALDLFLRASCFLMSFRFFQSSTIMLVFWLLLQRGCYFVSLSK